MPWPLRRTARQHRSTSKTRSLSATRPPRTRLGLTLLEGREVPSAVAVGDELSLAQTPGSLVGPRIAMSPGGRYVVTWQGSDGSGAGVRARMFNPDGSPFTSEFPVNTYTAGDQYSADLAMDDLGDFVVVWRSQGQDGEGAGVFGQRFHASGEKRGGEFQANVIWQNEQYEPAVAKAPDGQFVVAWTGYTAANSGWDVYARRYDADGYALDAQEFMVNTNTYWSQSGSRAAANADGFVFAYDSYAPESGTSPYSFAQAYTWDGAKRGGEVRLSSNPYHPWGSIIAVGMDAAGNFVTTFNQAYSWDTSGWGFYGQRFDPNGNRRGDTFLINTHTDNNQVGLSVAVAPDGSFTAAWTSDDQDGSGKGAYAQRFDANGNRDGGEFQVNSTTAGDQAWPQVASDAEGDTTVVWTGTDAVGGTGIFAQPFAQPQQIEPTKTVKLSTQTSPTPTGFKTLTVTTTVSRVGGSYLWEYVVHNDNFLDGDGAEPDGFMLTFDTFGVSNVSGSATITPDSIRWNSPPIPVGGEVKYSFMTHPRVSGDISAHAFRNPWGGETAANAVLGPAGPPPPIAFWTANPNAATDQLAVAKWQNSFQIGNDNKVQVIPNFLDLDRLQGDPDRFYVVVAAPGANKNPNAKEIIDVKVSTTHDSGGTLRFEETDVNSGRFWSPWLMLVANRADQRDSAVSQYRNRLFLVELGDEVWAEYAGTKATATVPVKYYVKVNVTILTMFPSRTPVNGATDEEAIANAEKDFVQANELFAQVGIKLVPHFQVKDEPANVDLRDYFSATTDENLTTEETALFSAPDFRTEATDDIELYYVNRFTNPGTLGISYLTNAPALARDTIVVASGSIIYTIPHEIGHILTDAGHYGEEYGSDPVIKAVNLMNRSPNGGGTGVTGRKRFTPGQENWILGSPRSPEDAKRPNLLSRTPPPG